LEWSCFVCLWEAFVFGKWLGCGVWWGILTFFKSFQESMVVFVLLRSWLSYVEC
jgi:hypothetical protein